MSELQSKNFKTTLFVNNVTNVTHPKGQLFTFAGDNLHCGVAVNHIGTVTQATNTTYPGGGSGAVVTEADVILLEKATGAGEAFAHPTSAVVYFDAAVNTQAVIAASKVTGTSCKVGVLAGGASATTLATQVLVHNFHGGNPVVENTTV